MLEPASGEGLMAPSEKQQQEFSKDRSATKQIAALLEEADKHIKDGNIDAALEVIRRAQAQDRNNVYALAYVERIQALMSARKAKGGPGKGASQWAPAAALKKAPTPPMADPARKPADSSADRADARGVAMRHAVDAFLARAREYSSAKNFDRALAELDRAKLLDPNSPGIDALEGEIVQARAEEEARELDLQQKRHRDEEERRRGLIDQELARVRREKEEMRAKEEQARRNAQTQKIQQYLKLAEEYFAAGAFEKASDQLTFVVVIDPLNAAAADIQRKIREIQERQRQDELELRRRKQEEEKQRAEAVRGAIRKNIEMASALTGEGNYAEALRLITRAYMLDPLNDEVRACEQGILEAQEESYRRAEEERRANEEVARTKQEEELRRVTEAEREKLLREQSAQLEQERRQNKEKVARHLSKAREFLGTQSYHDALAEVAQAFSLDPFDDDVKLVEQEILEAQHNGTRSEPAPQPEAIVNDGDSVTVQIEQHVEAAQMLRGKGEYARALDELTKAFALDPLNDTVRALEAEIEGEYHRSHHGNNPHPAASAGRVVEDLQNTLTDLTQQLTKNSPSGESQDQNKVGYHISRAKRLMESGALEDALAEVAMGMTVDAENADLRALEAAIWERQNGATAGEGMEQAEDNTRLKIKAHLDAAEDYQRQGEFGRALDEIAKAYQIDPLDDEIRTRENAIREEETRRAQSGESQLKLVYPRRGVAGGGM
jgi:Flp pilus assembly protein TadD